MLGDWVGMGDVAYGVSDLMDEVDCAVDTSKLEGDEWNT